MVFTRIRLSIGYTAIVPLYRGGQSAERADPGEIAEMPGGAGFPVNVVRGVKVAIRSRRQAHFG